MINKYQQEMKKEAEVETFSNCSLFVLLKVLIVSSIGQNLMIIFIFYHKFLLNKNVFLFHQFSKREGQGGNFHVNENISFVVCTTTSKYVYFIHLRTWFTYSLFLHKKIIILV